MDIPVENGHDNHGQTCEYDIIQLDVPFVKDGHGTESTPVGVEVVRHSQHYVLVEEVQNELCDEVIASTAVMEH